MSGSGAGSPPKYKLCPACRHIYPAASNFCPQDQTALVFSDDIIAGRYVIARRIGAGAMGTVFMAEDTQLGRRVALKLLKPAQDAQLRIDREAKAVGALDHDNVVRVYERGQHDDGRLYIAMEYLEGESLRSYLATQGRLPLRPALELWVQAVRGVAAAHKKHVIHRDLKPDNLFLAHREQDDGPLEQLKVLDFGIAQIRSAKPARGTVRIGTPGYVAPEQWMHGEATARSDVYSLGVILLEMLTGLRSLAANPQAPLEAVERLALSHTISPELRQLLAAVLSP
ncbi:MAG TPA: serine/threonine-protein kinase, partial [Pseudomonadota bacterium]|nr:serine/threonine-protein kinase [Pseudomonadota bacterium]